MSFGEIIVVEGIYDIYGGEGYYVSVYNVYGKNGRGRNESEFENSGKFIATIHKFNSNCMSNATVT